jgi:PEP-CTERM motif
MQNLGFKKFSVLAAAVVVALGATAAQAQSIPLNDASFESADLHAFWGDTTGGASTAPLGGALGNQYAVLDANESIYQSFTATVGGLYNVNFWATGDGRSRIFNSNDFATALGTSGDPMTAWGAGWHAASYTFTAIAGDSYHLYFSGKGAAFGVDGVTVAAAVPEPESYAMMLAGLGALGFVARRRKPVQH